MVLWRRRQVPRGIGVVREGDRFAGVEPNATPTRVVEPSTASLVIRLLRVGDLDPGVVWKAVTIRLWVQIAVMVDPVLIVSAAVCACVRCSALFCHHSAK